MISDLKGRNDTNASNSLDKEQTQVYSLKFKKPKIVVPNIFPDECPDLQKALIDICTWGNLDELQKEIINRTLKLEKLKKEEIKNRRNKEKYDYQVHNLNKNLTEEYLTPEQISKKKRKRYYKYKYVNTLYKESINEDDILLLNLSSNQNDESLLILNVGIKTYWTFALYDTGCQITLISKKFLEKSDATVLNYEKSNISLISINGKSKDNVLGKCTVVMKTITDDGEIVELPVEGLIVKDLKNFPAILGLNTIKKSKIEARLHEKCIFMNGKRISLYDYPGSDHFPIFPANNIRLRPNSKTDVNFIYDNENFDMSNIEYNESSFLRNNKIQISDIKPNKTLELVNNSKYTCEIHACRILGFVSNAYDTMSDIYNMHVKMKDDFQYRYMHNESDFEDNAQAKLPHRLPSDIEYWTLDDIKIHGTEEDKKQIRSLCEEYKHLFARSKLDVGLTKLMEHQIEIDHSKPIKHTKQIFHHGPALEFATKCLDMWLEMGIIEPAEQPLIISNLLLIPKVEAGSDKLLDRSKAGKLKDKNETKSWRTVVDLRSDMMCLIRY